MVPRQEIPSYYSGNLFGCTLAKHITFCVQWVYKVQAVYPKQEIFTLVEQFNLSFLTMVHPVTSIGLVKNIY
jgi:hypothetical protein